MPDWRNIDDYKYIDELTYSEFAWEYLRRNQDYRDDWKKYIFTPHSSQGYPASHVRAKKWFLDKMINPEEDKPLLKWQLTAAPQTLSRANRQYLLNKAPRYIAVGIDLGLSISHQIELLETRLEEQQEKYLKNEEKKVIEPPNNLKVLKIHFRLLDANLDGVSIANITKHFEKEKDHDYDYKKDVNIDNKERSTRQYLKAAKKFCKERNALLLLTRNVKPSG